MRIFNSLTRKVEEFLPNDPRKVTMYTCGPTVYSYPTIGNWRTYVLSDLIFRALTYFGFKVDLVINLTDVGHLVSDGDGGEDKLVKTARQEGKTAWEVAEGFTKDFLTGFDKLNLIKPMTFAKATEHISEQIDLIKKIEAKGLTYKTSDGIYFDILAYEASGNEYGLLSNLDEINKVGSRVEENQEKKDKRDFALWKFSPTDQKRDMEWESPWGVGFPGWHIECSAMSMKYLGEQLDLHIGGEDLKSTHHPNEIAQSEAATSKKPFCKFWVHGAFLTIDGGKMGKSLGNAYTLADVQKRGFDPMVLRYFYLTGHYRKQLNFTWEAFSGALVALEKLRHLMVGYREAKKRTQLSEEKLARIDQFRRAFETAISDDLNMPEALAVVWEMIKSNVPDYDKYELLAKFDEVLGLGLSEFRIQPLIISEEAKKLLDKREALRKEKKFTEADVIREQIEEMGYLIEDTQAGAKLISQQRV